MHVDDTARAVLAIIDSGVKHDIFNISGNYEEQNIVVIKKIIECIHGQVADIEPYINHMSRPGQDMRYSIDDTKLKNLGWTPQAVFDDELVKIVNYYTQHFVW